MAQYKHKKLGFIANLQGIQPDKIYSVHANTIYQLPAEFIENSCDWELIEEKPKLFYQTIYTEDGYTVSNPDTILYLATKVANTWYGETSSTLDTLRAKEVDDWRKYNTHHTVYKLFISKEKRDQFMQNNNKSKVLLTTEDGKEITNKTDEIWALDPISFTLWGGTAKGFYNEPATEYKIFSSKAARDEYILMNKPLLSIKEIKITIDDMLETTNFTEKNAEFIRKRVIAYCTSLAKSKL
jgi:hypothetical protein